MVPGVLVTESFVRFFIIFSIRQIGAEVKREIRGCIDF
jgi:hypothetical protein